MRTDSRYINMRPLVREIVLACTLLLAACSQTGEVERSSPDVDLAAIEGNRDLSVHEARAILAARDVVLIDVRTPREHEQARLDGTDLLIGYQRLGDQLHRLPEDKSAEILVYCRTARRSAIATDFLRQAGYTNVRNMLGGIVAWQSAGYPVASGQE